MKKVQISMDDELLLRIDAYASGNYMSRSGLIALSCTQFLNANQLTSAITDMSLCMRKIADKGEVDKETLEKMEDFERFAKYIAGTK